MIEKKSFTYKHQTNYSLNIRCLFACCPSLSKHSRAYSVMRCSHLHKTSFWICSSYSSQQRLRTFFSLKCPTSALLFKQGGTNVQVHQMPFQVYPKGLWYAWQLRLQRIFLKHKASTSKLGRGRGRGDKRGRIAEVSKMKHQCQYRKVCFGHSLCYTYFVLDISFIQRQLA